MGNYIISNGELYHSGGHKYLTKVWKNGKWEYTYQTAEEKAASKANRQARLKALEKIRETNAKVRDNKIEAYRKQQEANIKKNKVAELAEASGAKSDKQSVDKESRLSLLDTEEGRAKVRKERLAALLSAATTGDDESKKKKTSTQRQKALAYINKQLNLKR